LENFSQAVLEFFKSAISRSVPEVTERLSTEEIGKFVDSNLGRMLGLLKVTPRQPGSV